MIADTRGNLKDHSISMLDIMAAYYKMSQKAADFAYDKIFESGLGMLGEGLPDDLKSDFGKYVKALGSVYVPNTLEKIEQMMKSGSSSIAMLGRDAAKILMASEALNIEKENPCLRLIDPRLTVEEARRYYAWQGTILELRAGSLLTGNADPRSYFGIYVANKNVGAKSNLKTTISSRFSQ